MRIGILVMGATLALTPALACAQSLDTTFNTTGQFTLEIAGESSFFSSFTRQRDGKVVAVGSNRGRLNTVAVIGPPSYTYEPALDSRDLLVARVLSDGTLDSSFGVNGVTTIDFAGFDDRGADVAQLTDGKLLVLARVGVTAADCDVGLARLNSDGTLDTSFNSTGTVTLAVDGTDDRPTAMLLQPDGAVVIVGTTGPLVTATNGPTVQQGFAIRVLSDGTLDASFGTGGKTLVGDANNWVTLTAAARQSDGKVVATGIGTVRTPVPVARQIALRLTSDGVLDSSFGANGVSTPAGPVLLGTAVAVSDTITLHGLGGVATSASPLPPIRLTTYVTRLGGDGTLDSSFGTGGRIGGYVSSTRDYPSGLAIEPSGKILLSGVLTNNPLQPNGNISGPVQPFVARLLANGNVDTTFGTNGVFAPVFADAASQSRSGRLLRMSDGKLQLIGNTGQAASAALSFGEVVPDSQRGFILQLNSSPTYAFSGTGASVREDQDSLELSVTRTGNTNGNVSVRVTTNAQSASAGTDFMPIDTTLTWTPQDASTKTIALTVVNDAIQEGDEQLTVTISEPSEGSLDNASSVAVTISDDDLP